MSLQGYPGFSSGTLVPQMLQKRSPGIKLLPHEEQMSRRC
jgi:hypothetical protein